MVATSHLGFLVISLLAGIIAAGFVALIDSLLRRHDHFDRDAGRGRYDELPVLERRNGPERRGSVERRRDDRRSRTPLTST